MNLNEQNPDVIIIGGGLAGLAAATMLARAGRWCASSSSRTPSAGAREPKSKTAFISTSARTRFIVQGRLIKYWASLGSSLTGECLPFRARTPCGAA